MEEGWIDLADEIRQMASALPPEVILTLANTLNLPGEVKDWPYLRSRVLFSVNNAVARSRINALIDAWQDCAAHVTGEVVALALVSASRAVEHNRQAQRLELVWTGPESQAIPLRRTEQALLQVINSAARRLLIVSFVVYDIEEIARALLRAAQRGVVLTICLETPDASAGKVAYNTLRALGNDLSRQADLYYWPLVKRPVSQDGRTGSLHAKVAVADGESMLLSSANLTGNAMSLNMEMGVLIHGGGQPAHVEAHFQQLIASGVLEQIRE
jgi:phosphatidylserine/phosphatidylglycerophosphate/cardiolipin synthase-like enzyme